MLAAAQTADRQAQAGRTALQWLPHAHAWEALASLMLSSYPVAFERALEALALLDEQPPNGQQVAVRARALNTCFSVCFKSGDLGQALDYSRATMTLAEAGGDPYGAARAVHNHGTLLSRLHEHDAARQGLRRNLRLMRQGGRMARLQVYAIGALAIYHFHAGRTEYGLRLQQAAVARLAGAGYQTYQFRALDVLVRMQVEARCHGDALQTLRTAQALRARLAMEHGGHAQPPDGLAAASAAACGAAAPSQGPRAALGGDGARLGGAVPSNPLPISLPPALAHRVPRPIA